MANSTLINPLKAANKPTLPAEHQTAARQSKQLAGKHIVEHLAAKDQDWLETTPELKELLEDWTYIH